MEQRAVASEQKIDEHVIEACQQGDREAFRLLFETYQSKVYSISLYYFKGDESSARDVTQAVFLKLMTKIEQFRRDAEFTTWLYRLVANACMDEQRKRRRFLPFGDGFMGGQDVEKKGQEKHYERIELADSVKAAIGELKPKLRLPMLLKYVEGLSYDEMAEALDCSKGTIASRLNRGHKILAQRLSHLRGALSG
ncbi:MAG: sigma-70 family RNA polymerase sigma factor [Acidobacteria bacterium]|jgi:RNA polymerase sigma-70 factor (ECF subfamily)|nr:sigma-70 family RNA polymerase sigma factor [Acidobacteriota bacterium]